MNDWQPIETAPKDGTRVLVNSHWMDATGKRLGVEIAHWREEGYWQCLERQPTHWMPLPDPPKEI